MSARELAGKFFGHVEAGEVDEILAMMTPDATVSLVPLNRCGPMAADGASYLRELARAFPDLMVRVRRLSISSTDFARWATAAQTARDPFIRSCARRSKSCRPACPIAST